MENQVLKIRRFDYLKKPYYHWTLLNNVGGSFSNSGQYTSFNKCIAHGRSVGGLDVKVETYSVDIDGNETLISEMSNKGAI